MRPEDPSEPSRAAGTLPPASQQARGTVENVGQITSTVAPAMQRTFALSLEAEQALRPILDRMDNDRLNRALDHPERLAELQGFDPRDVRSVARGVRERRAEHRAFWTRIALGVLAAVVALAGIAASLLGE
jgi:hypothetical protein